MSTRVEKLGLENISFYAHVVVTIAAVWDALKVLREGYVSIWATILGLNWVLGMMISMTFLFVFLAAISVTLLPAALTARAVQSASSWVFSDVKISGVLALISFFVAFGIWKEVMDSPKAEKVVPVIIWVLAPLVGALAAFRGELKDFAPFWVTVIRVVGWLAMLVLLLILTGVIKGLKEKPRPS
jgi:hypothetical protein